MVKLIPALQRQDNWVDYALEDVLQAWDVVSAGVCKSGKSLKVRSSDDTVRTIALAKKDQGHTSVSDFKSLRVIEVTRDGETFPVAFTPGTGEQAEWLDIKAIFSAVPAGKTL